VPDKFAVAAPLHNLGQMLHHQGDDIRAHKLLSESLAILRQIGDRPSISVCLADIAGVWATQKQPEKAAKLFGAAEALRENLRATMYDAQRLAYEWDVKQGMSQMDEAAWRAAWAGGRELSLEAACELAMGEPISAPIPEQVVEKDPFGLTEREQEILKLLVEGLTYAEIADEVTLSFHTVHAHLRSIYGKMGVSSRNQATRIAMENGIR
jgi:ATP/maltotriose-dependent transcriptional regulator MalT